MLKREITESVNKIVHIVYIPKDIASWWNSKQWPNEIRQFCGYYWVKGVEEGGPFKSHSAAVRDAYYYFVKKQNPPSAANAVAYGRNKQVVHLTKRVRKVA